MIYPIVEYSHVIGKNTADFTPTDLVNFTKWWMKRPEKDIIMGQIKAQQTRAAKTGHKIQEDKKGATDMSKKHNVKAFQAAQHSRLNPKQIEEIDDAGSDDMTEEFAEEMVIEEEVVEEETVVEAVAEEDPNVVATIGLSNEDIAALLWSINTVLEEYDFTGNKMGETLTTLKEILEGA